MAYPRLTREDLEHILTHTRDLWMEARGSAIFITGGTGFFGMWLLESFAHANDSLGLGMNAVVLTRDPTAFAKKAPHLTARADLKFAPGDVRDFAFPTGRFAYVIHAAAETGARFIDEDPQEMLDAIVSGTRRVLEFSAQSGARKLLFVSSGAVYGRQPAELTHVPEDYTGRPDPLQPGWAYGEGKRVSEHLCLGHAQRFGCEVKIARCFAFVGPHLPLDAHFAVGNFIRDALGRRPIRVTGDGTAVRSYLYASDLAIWLWTILFRGLPARAYNVGSGNAQSIAAIANEVSVAMGVNPPVLPVVQSLPTSSVSRYVPDVQRALELGLHQSILLRDAIRRTAGWHNENSND